MATLRDKLALERTRLANERTFLAYVRTSLSLIAGAAVLFQFFSAVHAYLAVAWVLAILGLLVLVLGTVRFRTVQKELRWQIAADGDE
jgi:putative membrane protein